jgi:hypothetical protein
MMQYCENYVAIKQYVASVGGKIPFAPTSCDINIIEIGENK